jgi:8-oxo-dGTP pyrophosphatase MutT (NUDIX family)
MSPETAQILSDNESFSASSGGIFLSAELDCFDKRSATLASAAENLSRHYGVKLCSEKYPVVQKWGDEILAEIDRSALPWLGMRGHGVHVNGFTRNNDGIRMWIAERAKDRRIDPGKLDNLIGGGLPIGLSIEENLAKEAKEEAGMDAELALTAKPAGYLRYKKDMMNGVRNDALFIFDLELPEDFVPRNTDGEVASFNLTPLEEVAEIIRTTDRFKFNCNLVIIDFMLRHGLLAKKHREFKALIYAFHTIRSQLFATN